MRPLLAVAACLLLAAPAQAHTLTMAGAERMAERYVKRVAAEADRPAMASASRCRRRTRHIVDCISLFRFGAVICERRVRVRFTSTEHRRVSVRFAGTGECW